MSKDYTKKHAYSPMILFTAFFLVVFMVGLYACSSPQIVTEVTIEKSQIVEDEFSEIRSSDVADSEEESQDGEVEQSSTVLILEEDIEVVPDE